MDTAFTDGRDHDLIFGKGNGKSIRFIISDQRNYQEDKNSV